MDLVDFIGVIRKWKWLVLPIVLLVTGYTIVTGTRSPATYRAEAMVVAGLSQIASSSSGGISIAQSGERIGATYAELVTAQPVLEKAIEKAGLDWQPTLLRGIIATEIPRNTPVLKVSVTDSDPARAQLLANSVAEAFVEYIQDVSTVGGDAAKGILTSELDSIEKDIVDYQTGAIKLTEAQNRALQDRRDTVLREYTDLLDQQARAGDVRVANPADDVERTGSTTLQRALIAFGISLVAGVALAFVAEGISKSVRAPREGSS